MASETIQIKRYPNRRFYARHISKYVSLQEIEDFISQGFTVEIRDSQTGEELTRLVLTQIIMERHPDKMSLFPTDMLHLILRSNEVMSDFLRDYFRQSLSYLEYLQQHGPAAATLAQPMHWLKAWMEGVSGSPAPQDGAAAEAPSESEKVRRRIEQLERRIRQLESTQPEQPQARDVS